jgi:hypothetical protein
MSVARALLSYAIDYAGMFPPAGLDLQTTVRNYESYRAGGDAWALGRLILPAKAMSEFAKTRPAFAEEWPISLLLSADLAAEISEAVIRGLSLEVVECRPARIEHIAELRRLLPNAMAFVEAPVGDELEEWMRAIAAAGVCAKIRTGGVAANAIPQAAAVAGFLVGCARHGVCLKATAGLHHAIRAEHALTYEPRSERATMHGFVNFFVAAAMALEGADERDVEAALSDETAANFAADEESVRWREHEFSAQQIKRMRERFVVSFGSCSFTEPLEEMRAMGWVA